MLADPIRPIVGAIRLVLKMSRVPPYSVRSTPVSAECSGIAFRYPAAHRRFGNSLLRRHDLQFLIRRRPDYVRRKFCSACLGESRRVTLPRLGGRKGGLHENGPDGRSARFRVACFCMRERRGWLLEPAFSSTASFASAAKFASAASQCVFAEPYNQPGFHPGCGDGKCQLPHQRRSSIGERRAQHRAHAL